MRKSTNSFLTIRPAAVLAVLICLMTVMAGIVSCDLSVGMGPVVDIVPPSINIRNPVNNQYMDITTGEPVVLDGTWSDNVGLSSLTLVNGRNEPYAGAGYVINSDNTWQAWIPLSQNGTYDIKVQAFDTGKNTASDQVAVRIDIIEPFIQYKEIIRHADSLYPRAGFKDKSFFDALNYQLPKAYTNIKYENIDDFQNETFTIRITIEDNFAIAHSRLHVYDEDGNELAVLEPDAASNVRKPEWFFDHNKIKGLKPSYDTGAHFLQFRLEAWDEANWDNFLNEPKPNANSLFQTIQGLCWYPESDDPHILVQQNTTGWITLPPNTENALEAVFFDDDELSAIYTALILKSDLDKMISAYNLSATEEEYTEEEYLEAISKTAELRDPLLGEGNAFGPNLNSPTPGTIHRDQTVKLATKEKGEYRLLALVQDKKSSPGETRNEPRWAIYPSLRVLVQDPDAPIIIVETPNENIFPDLSNGETFKIKGYTIDNGPTKVLQIAWVPEGFIGTNLSTYIATAQNALESSSREGEIEYIEPGTSDVRNGGITIWSVDQGPAENYTLNGKTYQRRPFEQEFNVLTDFIFNNTLENTNKCFLIHTFDGDNDTFRIFRLLGYNTPPVLEILSPARDLLVYDRDKTMTLRFRVFSPKQIGFKEDKYIIKDITPGHAEASPDPIPPGHDGNITRDINPDGIQEGERRTYQFEAEDRLGNQIMAQRTVIFSKLPVLNYITSPNNDQSYGINQPLRFQAVFSMPVRVTGSPRLKLYFDDDVTGAPDAYAVYEAGPASNTVNFTYTVQAEDNSEKLHTPLKAIDLNGGAMETTEEAGGAAIIDLSDNANSLQGRKAIGVDGIKPVINSVSFPKNGGATGYYNMGKSFTIVLESSEPVRIAGSPDLVITYGDQTGYAAFSNVTESEGISLITFSYTVPGSLPDTINEQPVVLYAIEYPGGAAITDAVGNPLDLAGFSVTDDPAYIDTQAPYAPLFAIHTAETGGSSLLDSPVMYHDDLYIGVTGEPGASLSYSLQDGNNPQSWTGSRGKIADADRANNGSSDYAPSSYQVTAWQFDRAGNRSLNAATRTVDINSRAPDLVAITCEQPNGSYPAGASLTFKLTFKDKVKAASDAPKLTIKGTVSGFTSEYEILMKAGDNRDGSTFFNFNWPSIAEGLLMQDIKVQSIDLSGVKDLYGNSLKNYTISDSPGTGEITIESGVNLQRDHVGTTDPGLKIDSVRPSITSSIPGFPSGDGDTKDGDIVTKGPDGRQTLQFVFDDPVSAESGGVITIRPYGDWLVPPVLSNAEFLELKNSLSADELKVLWYTNDSGIPLDTDGNQLWDEVGNPVDDWPTRTTNFYKKTTQGLTINESDGDGVSVKPDTSTKYVLDYSYDLDDDNGPIDTLLRPVFNKAEWEWQTIQTTSADVRIYDSQEDMDAGNSPVNQGNYVAVSIPGELAQGRIWEVSISQDAFRDAAGNGNGSAAFGEGKTYRFWSGGASKPWIRVNRTSYNYSQWTTRTSTAEIRQQVRPDTDVLVRIDSQTPGATIYYGVRSGDHLYTQTHTGALNGGNYWSNNTTNTDRDTTAPTAIRVSDATTGQLKGIATTTPYADSFYAGDKNENANQTARNNYADLFTGRKDYVKAYAIREAGNGGPALDESENAYEGVFKTVIMVNDARNNGNGNGSPCFLELNIRGSDTNGQPSVSGFPLRYSDTYEQKFFRIAYRVGTGAGPTSLGNGGKGYISNTNDRSTNTAADNDHYYVWISFEILTDWNLSFKGWHDMTVAGHSFYPNPTDAGGRIPVTYGTVAYRYQPRFWSGH